MRQSANSVMEIHMISNNGKLNCFSKTFWQSVQSHCCQVQDYTLEKLYTDK